MVPGDLVEFSSTHLALDHEELRGTYGILLRHLRDRRWKGGKWFTLWQGRVIVIMGMDLRVVGSV